MYSLRLCGSNRAMGNAALAALTALSTLVGTARAVERVSPPQWMHGLWCHEASDAPGVFRRGECTEGVWIKFDRDGYVMMFASALEGFGPEFTCEITSMKKRPGARYAMRSVCSIRKMEECRVRMSITGGDVDTLKVETPREGDFVCTEREAS